MCDKCRRECEDCQRMENEIGIDNLTICDRCSHYYTGDYCSCLDKDEWDNH